MLWDTHAGTSSTESQCHDYLLEWHVCLYISTNNNVEQNNSQTGILKSTFSVIAPWWPTQSWWLKVLSRSVHPAIKLSQDYDLFSQPRTRILCQYLPMLNLQARLIDSGHQSHSALSIYTKSVLIQIHKLHTECFSCNRIVMIRIPVGSNILVETICVKTMTEKGPQWNQNILTIFFEWCTQLVFLLVL